MPQSLMEKMFPSSLGVAVDTPEGRAAGDVVFEVRMQDSSRLNFLVDTRPHTEQMAWLWPGRIPQGAVTLIEGPAGAGKSYVALDLAARLSDGRAWPDGTPQNDGPAGILIVCRQDQQAKVVSARLEGLGGQRDRIAQAHSFLTVDPPLKDSWNRKMTFPVDLPAIERKLELSPSIRLVVIDPLSDFCQKKDFGAVLTRLNELANQFNVAIVVTLRSAAKFDRQGQLVVKSKFDTEAARCVWCCATDPNDPERRLFLPTLMNYAKLPLGHAFAIGDLRLDWCPEPVDPRDAVCMHSDCEKWLHNLLSQGDMPCNQVWKLGKGFGFSSTMLQRAATRLKVERKREGFGKGARIVWSVGAGPPAEIQQFEQLQNELKAVLLNRDDEDGDDDFDLEDETELDDELEDLDDAEDLADSEDEDDAGDHTEPASAPAAAEAKKSPEQQPVLSAAELDSLVTELEQRRRLLEKKSKNKKPTSAKPGG